MAAMAMTGEHPEDVLKRLADWQDADQTCALVIIINTEGGAVRAPGALLAVSEHASFGYISGGCIDADVILQSRLALNDLKPRELRYGAGSPFVDLPLPCGGAIDVLIVPNPAHSLIRRLCEGLSARRPVSLQITTDETVEATGLGLRSLNLDKTFHYQPKLRLRIAGRGADALALAKISDAAGFETGLQLLDDDDVAEALNAGLTNVEQLTTASGLPSLVDDRWTAFVLLFHDRDWEIPLLTQALAGPAFYVGAVGSRRTHAIRCDELRAAGSREDDIARIHGPIGLVPSLRDASLIALSTLAEIIEVSRQNAESRKTAFVLLAAGASSRFECGDKLLAQMAGESVLQRSAAILNKTAPTHAIAVIEPENKQRKDILVQAGWTVVENEDAATGQASSLVCALEQLKLASGVEQIVILLGDMPNIPASHVQQMISLAQDNETTAIMSECDGILCPPSLFKRQHFEALMTMTGDRGAKSIFLNLGTGAQTQKLSSVNGVDIDREADICRALETENA